MRSLSCRAHLSIVSARCLLSLFQIVECDSDTLGAQRTRLALPCLALPCLALALALAIFGWRTRTSVALVSGEEVGRRAGTMTPPFYGKLLEYWAGRMRMR